MPSSSSVVSLPRWKAKVATRLISNCPRCSRCFSRLCTPQAVPWCSSTVPAQPSLSEVSRISIMPSSRPGMQDKVVRRHWPTCSSATTTPVASSPSHSTPLTTTCPTSSTTAWRTAPTVISVVRPSTPSAMVSLTRRSMSARVSSQPLT